VRLWPRIDWQPDADACLARLIAETPWRQDEVQVWGKTHLQPRLHAWYGDEGMRYRYSGLELAPLPWTPLLSSLRRQVEVITGAEFNSVLLNYYRDHRDSMGMHADDEPELGSDPVIASVSFGEERVLRFKHRRDRNIEPVKLPLPHGSLLLMRGATQANWHHGINKLTRPCGPRANLTFRRIVV
jgi:alkylated DNA repair dioxygenase AlkB